MQKITALYICLEHVQSLFISFISCARKQKQGLHVIHIQISLCKIVWKTKILRTRLGWREGLLKKCLYVHENVDNQERPLTCISSGTA